MRVNRNSGEALPAGERPAACTQRAQSPMERRYVEFSDVRKVYPAPKGPLTVVDGFDLNHA